MCPFNILLHKWIKNNINKPIKQISFRLKVFLWICFSFLAPPTPTLTQWPAQLDMFETEAVELSCKVNQPGWTFLWYKDNNILQEKGSLFKIGSITASDKGKYYCRAHLKPRGVTSGDSSTAEIAVYRKFHAFSIALPSHWSRCLEDITVYIFLNNSETCVSVGKNVTIN